MRDAVKADLATSFTGGGDHGRDIDAVPRRERDEVMIAEHSASVPDLKARINLHAREPGQGFIEP
jgi:hypothetical protein